MPESSASILKQLVEAGLGYVWLVVLAIWGGTVNYLTRRKKDKSMPFSVIELLGEWVISAFAGVLTAFICQEMGMSYMFTCAMAGIAGHMGGRAIFMLELWVQKRIGISSDK
ncbi:phage holin family protein [Shewanella sp. 202IG2-18]|uniref:phage holin family protein n=1 Tax=Parashewanella hymeniacidonis TaxID=2807618 RepID=UPI001961C7D9|nr:phage holin family protein [Parashewanella hymeniacidonis]MBM7070886.1 phage holin family protein [Parashewanella hymeniacidonis]